MVESPFNKGSVAVLPPNFTEEAFTTKFDLVSKF
jgi:hypothetical protein